MDQYQQSWQQIWNSVEICTKVQGKTSQFFEKKVSFYEDRSLKLRTLANILKGSLKYYETFLTSIKPVSMNVDPGAERDWKPVTNQLETYIEFLMNSRQVCVQQIREYEKRAEKLKQLSRVQAESLKYYRMVVEYLYSVHCNGAITKHDDGTVNINNSKESVLEPMYARIASKERKIVEMAHDKTKKRLLVNKKPTSVRRTTDEEVGQVEEKENGFLYSHGTELLNNLNCIFSHRTSVTNRGYEWLREEADLVFNENNHNHNHEKRNRKETNNKEEKREEEEEGKKTPEERNEELVFRATRHHHKTLQRINMSANLIMDDGEEEHYEKSTNKTTVAPPSRPPFRDHSSFSSNTCSGSVDKRSMGDNLVLSTDRQGITFSELSGSERLNDLVDQDQDNIARSAVVTSTNSSHKSKAPPMKNKKAGQLTREHITKNSTRSNSRGKTDHDYNNKPQWTANALTQLKTGYAIRKTNKSELLDDVEHCVVLDLHKTITNFHDVYQHQQQHKNNAVKTIAGNSRELLETNNTVDSLRLPSPCTTSDQHITDPLTDLKPMFSTIHTRCDYMPTISECSECDGNNTGSAGCSIDQCKNNKNINYTNNNDSSNNNNNNNNNNNKQILPSNVSVGAMKNKNTTNWSVVNDGANNNYCLSNDTNNIDQNANYTVPREDHYAENEKDSVFSDDDSSDLDFIPSILDCVGRGDEDTNSSRQINEPSQLQNVNKLPSSVLITPLNTTSSPLSSTNGHFNINNTSTEVISSRGNRFNNTSVENASSRSGSVELKSSNKTVNVQYRRKKWNGFTIKST